MTKPLREKHISIEKLEEMFENISSKTNWDMKKPMLWGYFFANNEYKALENARDALVSKGYRFVDIYLSDKESPSEPEVWWLHVEKEEVHTPHTLDKRNDELRALASDLDLDSYDGMDVGPIRH